MRAHYLQPAVGHYGVFNGSRYPRRDRAAHSRLPGELWPHRPPREAASGPFGQGLRGGRPPDLTGAIGAVCCKIAALGRASNHHGIPLLVFAPKFALNVSLTNKWRRGRGHVLLSEDPRMPLVWASAAFGIVMMGVAGAARSGSQPMMTGGLDLPADRPLRILQGQPGRMLDQAARHSAPCISTTAVWQEMVDVNTHGQRHRQADERLRHLRQGRGLGLPARRRRLRGLCAREAPRPDAQGHLACPIC